MLIEIFIFDAMHMQCDNTVHQPVAQTLTHMPGRRCASQEVTATGRHVPRVLRTANTQVLHRHYKWHHKQSPMDQVVKAGLVSQSKSIL